MELRENSKGDTGYKTQDEERVIPILSLESWVLSLIGIALFSVAVILVTLAAGRSATFTTIERAMEDLRFRIRGQAVAVDPRLSLILADAATMDRYGNPVPRRYYALVANMLCENGASAVVLDRIFEARKEFEDAVGGKMLSSVLKRHDNIISAWWAPLRARHASPLQSAIVPLRFAMPHKMDEIDISPYETSLHREEVSLPYDEALQSVSWLGSIAIPATKEAGTRVEKIPLVVKHGDRIYPAISLAAVCAALKVDMADIVIKRDGMFIPTQDGVIAIPTDQKGQIRINFLGDSLGDISVPLKNTYSLFSVYESILSGHSIIPLESLKDGVVLMGSFDITGADMHSTPFGSHIPGVAIHAMVINSILQGRFIGTLSWYYNLFILAISVFCVSYTQKLLSPKIGLICLIALLVCIWAGAVAYFQFKGILVNISQPVFGMVFAFASMTFYNYEAERRRVRHIRQVFGKHVSQEIMDQLVLETDGQVPMAEREVSVLFADIKDHSNWARHLHPSEFAEELNECLETMAQAAFENGGTINSFTGDGVLVIYNAPVRQDDHVLRAIKTGIAIQENTSKLNEERAKQDKPPIAVRVGINTGPAMAGTLGSKDRLEYTVIGDTINMAKRTEGECEPGQVAITDDVIREVGGAIQVESIGMRSVKGRESGLMLYHVVKVKEE